MEPWLFARAILRHWGAVMTGLLLAAAGAMFANLPNRFVALCIFWTAAAAAFIVAFYRVWLDEHRSKVAVVSKERTETHKDTVRVEGYQILAEGNNILRKIKRWAATQPSEVPFSELEAKSRSWFEEARVFIRKNLPTLDGYFTTDAGLD